jgi:D-arabinose 1-dehydrogenase-like Zn-dependent alcohol dehydrogenase
MFARAAGAEVHVMGRNQESLAFAESLGFMHAWTEDTLPNLPFDAVIDASNDAHLPALALELVEPAGRVVYVGLAGMPSMIDARTLALKDVTAVGILSASPGLDDTIAAYASGAVDPRPLVAATVGLQQVGAVLAGARPEGAGPGPKIHVDPRLGS